MPGMKAQENENSRLKER